MNRKITYCEALNEATRQAMECDSTVFNYGIGVSDHTRIFNTLTGIVEQFGEERCVDTPLSEDALTGLGLGAAINGLKPIYIHIRVDFLLLAINQIANMMSSYYYNTGGQLNVPIVIRTIIGRGWGQGCQHSKACHSIFAHFPGIKVIMPTTPSDAKGMLLAAIEDKNPVISFEHRWLYCQNGFVNSDYYTTPLGKANVIREGSDVTIIATSWTNVEALQAAEILLRHGISVEIIDPRTVYPLDIETIVNSVRKTKRCFVVDNDWTFCGFSAELSATVSETCFSSLIAPVQRLGFATTPCPTARHLENEFYPSASNIVNGITNMLGKASIDLSKEIFYNYENKFKGPF